MALDFRVISIGTLAAHPLWDEGAPVRTGHATTTIVESEDAVIVVDPGLPARALGARLSERSRRQPEDVTHVFITTFTEDHYRGAGLFPNAEWLVHEPERDAAERALRDQLDRAEDAGDTELVSLIESHLDRLGRTRVAPDRIATGVDLFPLPGVSPGTCGLLLAQPLRTVLICGDAVATSEHVGEAKVLPSCLDVEQAQESFREALEIADVIVPGRDNVTASPLTSGNVR